MKKKTMHDVYTNEDFAILPPVIQKYLSNCGYN